MSDVYHRMVRLLQTGFGLEPDEISPDQTFDDLELDSLAMVELSLAAQEEFGVPVDDEDISPQDTVSRAAEVIEAKGVTV
ncbi:acyl carrier protein [Streptomyces roseirectus]|uniref:Acyl carrier protein n=1 Tax=Streptomyces roseirectus TaxID=2768066 RepID=A0A7H0I842_9ACTN|nr:phosphopantetheine-binding protein [Streptomyces roseirectus]QNP68958.1 acyl carrier protein [Streptomyces roseirectus]